MMCYFADLPFFLFAPWFLDKRLLIEGCAPMTYSMKNSANIITETLSVWEKAECYEDVVNHSQRFFTRIQMNNFWFFLQL